MRAFIALVTCIPLIYQPLRPRTQDDILESLRYSEHGTLILAVYTQDGFALAADGATVGSDGSIQQTQKIFPIGQSGAMTFVGYLAVQDAQTHERVDVLEIANGWLSSHPKAMIEQANAEINSLIQIAFKKFFASRDPGKEAGSQKFRVVSFGLQNGRALAIRTKYFLPERAGNSMRTEQTSDLPEGKVLALGKWKVQEELMGGTSNALQAFKTESAVQKFRASPSKVFSLSDYINLFDTILRATESEQGKAFDSDPAIVGPPNRFALITAKSGFYWVKPESAR
jgi:hypothetical protein